MARDLHSTLADTTHLDSYRLRLERFYREKNRVQHIFHITHDQMQAHWDIFFPAYLGTSDPQAIDDATRRLMPYYAANVPYIFDMVFSKPMPDAALQNIIKRF